MISEVRTSAPRAPDTGRTWPARQPPVRRFPIGAPPASGSAAIPDARVTGKTSRHFAADLARQMIELRGYALWLCRSGSLADDLIQETLLNAWAARDRFEEGTNLKAWCTTILKNAFFSYKRRSWRTLPLSDDMIANLAADDCSLDHRLQLLSLRQAIALLPADQREAILLVGVGSKSYIEAAHLCGCAVGTVKSRVSRARVQLAELMLQNKQSLISNSRINASDALDDLMDQFVRLARREDHADGLTARDTPTPFVQSEPV